MFPRLFGGYSYLWENTKHASGRNASVALNANRWLTLVGDISGHYPAKETEITRLSTTTFDVDQYCFYFGSRFSVRKLEHITPYLHLLLGGCLCQNSDLGNHLLQPSSHRAVSVLRGAIDKPLYWAAGAGLDIKASERITVRLIQTDYIRDTGQIGLCRLICSQGLRFSSGVVIGLGNK